MTPVV